eukprot:CAMPEP_0183525232 /NCGR_PEP_ID=MMETSP0371-20130417/20491_1 /TAXON_ID=268820 /ORGANISM="Peridinium aciculiferum, Strain PAER-2" /LENGTH=35 /DNA_ID= /DNA_START= /DNA_END= /DNA_ORIENTATION=
MCQEQADDYSPAVLAGVMERRLPPVLLRVHVRAPV